MQFNPQEFAEFMEMWQAYKVFQQMTQPNPNPMQAAAPIMPNTQQIVQQSSAAVSVSTQEVDALKAEIEKLKAQLAESQSKLTAAEHSVEQLKLELNTAKGPRQAELQIEQLEKITQKSASELIAGLEKGEQIVAHKGKAAYDFVKQAIDEGIISNEDANTYDSDGLIDGITAAKKEGKSIEEVLDNMRTEEYVPPQKRIKDTKAGMVGF